MREFYTTEQATQDSFLFISYSHDEQTAVKEWADYLVEQGVRVWWDKAFLGGDDWETTARELLSHANCCGILFFGSKSAIESPNVAKEWRVAAKTKEGCPENGFYAQIIMATDDPEVDYKYLTNFVKRTEDLYSDDDYDDFRSLFGKKDHLFYSVGNQADKEALLQTIKQRVPQAVDEHTIIREKLADISNLDKEVVLRLGAYGDDRKPLFWHQISQGETDAVLLCREILTEEYGGKQTEEWLGRFVRSSFSTEEQEALQGKIRLLTCEEAETVAREELAADTLWWLEDSTGNLQAVVREDGTVYPHGYNNRLYRKGIRPVIALDVVTLYSLTKR